MRLFNPNPVYLLFRGVFRIFFRIMGSWRIQGLEYIPKTGQGIVISNHTSYVDPPMMGSAVRRPIAYMAKQELFTGNKLLRWVCIKLESYPVKQGTVDREALRYTFDKLEKGWLIGLFPEGTRSNDGNLLPFQPGLAMIALRTKAPVIPCGVAGAFEMLSPGSSKIKKSPIEVHFGPPIELSDLYEMEDRKAASRELLKRSEAAVASLVQQAETVRALRL